MAELQPKGTEVGDSRMRPARGGHRLPQNISEVERLGSVLAGGGLLLAGLKRGATGGLLMALAGGGLLYRGLTGHCSCYSALGIYTHRRRPTTAVPAQQGYKCEKQLTIHRPADELYRHWRDVENLPQVLSHLVSVRAIDARHSHWVAEGPWHWKVAWDAEIFQDRPNELIAWRSLEGSQMDTAGSLHLQPAPRGKGTLLKISLKYNPPGGKLGARIAQFLECGLEQQLEEDLLRFKQRIESGQALGSQQPVARPA